MLASHSQYCVSCNVRAYRVAHLLDVDGSYEQARRVVQFGSFRWGGIFNVAIPMTRGKIESDWWEFLRWYDPDVILIHDGNHPDFTEPTDHGLLPFRVISPNPPFDTAYNHLINPKLHGPSDELLQEALWESESRRGNIPLENWRVVETESAPDQEFLEANVGVVSGEEDLKYFDYMGTKRVPVQEGTFLWGLTRPDIEWSQLSQTGFQLRKGVGLNVSLFLYNSALFVVSAAPNLQDFCLFWSARASRHGWQPVYWIPCEWAGSMPDCIGALVPGERRGAPQRILVQLTSATLPADELDELADTFPSEEHLYRVESPTSVLQQVPDSPDCSTFATIRRYPIGEGRASFAVPNPAPDFERPYGGLGRWAVDISMESVASGSQGVRFPRSPGLADRILHGAPFLPSTEPPETESRVMWDGRLSTGVTGYDSDIFVDLPGSLSIFEHALQARSFRSAVRNVNYRRDRRQLFQPSPRAYKTVERSHHGLGAIAVANKLTDWTDTQQLLGWNSRLQTLVGATRSAKQIADLSGAEQEMIDEFFLPFLVKRQILLQGYYLKCTHCNESAWYPLDDVGQQYRCSACLNTNQTPYKPEYSYKLTPLAERAVEHCQLLPLAATALLAQEAKSDFIWEPELLLKDPVGKGFQPSDIDICCVRDGELIIGEAAWDGGFLKKDANKLVRLARLLQPAEIVFAVMRRELKPGDQELIHQVEEAVKPHGTTVTVFLQHHLLEGKRDAKPRVRFVGNTQTGKVHRMMCSYGPKRSRTWFVTYQDAAKQGYRPCKFCKPNSS